MTGSVYVLLTLIEPHQMNFIRFIKTNSKYDKVEFVKNGCVSAKTENPKQGILPHDCIHALVEQQLGIRGLTDMVFDGQSPGTAMNPDGEAWLSEATVESIQGMLWSGKLDAQQFNDWVQSICEQRRVSFKAATPEQFLELELKIEDYGVRWKATDVGSALEVPWPR